MVNMCKSFGRSNEINSISDEIAEQSNPLGALPINRVYHQVYRQEVPTTGGFGFWEYLLESVR